MKVLEMGKDAVKKYILRCLWLMSALYNKILRRNEENKNTAINIKRER